jgi:hypothetical protein
MPDFLAEVLTWPSNYSYALAVQTAMDHHFAPTVFIINDKQPTDPWSVADKKLALAWTILQKETCRECGQPLWICRSNNVNLYFSVQTDTCYAKAELDRWEAKPNRKAKPGESAYIVPDMRSDDGKLPTRKQYLEQIDDD